MNLNPQSFTGLQPDVVRDTDYIQGVSSPLAPIKVMISSDWTPYDSYSDRQSIPGVFDTMNCTAFGLARNLEFWFNYYISTGQIAPGSEHFKFLQNGVYFDTTGHIKLSTRFMGAVSGTGSEGNSMTTVLDACRTYGICSDSMWTWDKSKQKTFSTYYATPSKEAYEQAARFRELFTFTYERVTSDSSQTLSGALQEAPLYYGLITCDGWYNTTVPWCGISGTNHCVTGIAGEGKIIGDSYPEYIKHLSNPYRIPSVFKVYLTIKQTLKMTKKYIINDHGKLGILVTEGYGAQIIYADSAEMWNQLKTALKVDEASTPKINLP